MPAANGPFTVYAQSPYLPAGPPRGARSARGPGRKVCASCAEAHVQPGALSARDPWNSSRSKANPSGSYDSTSGVLPPVAVPVLGPAQPAVTHGSLPNLEGQWSSPGQLAPFPWKKKPGGHQAAALGGALRLPPGILADKQETQKAYNSIDESVYEELSRKLERLAHEHESVPISEATGAYIVVEHCHSCSSHHALTTRHDEREYENRANVLMSHILNAAHGVVLGVASMECQLLAEPRCLANTWAEGHEVWHHGSRVGAFEVYLLTPRPRPAPDGAGSIRLPLPTEGLSDKPSTRQAGSARCWGAQLKIEGGYIATLLHSKLSSNAWASKSQIVERLLCVLPPAVALVRVICPSGKLLPRFKVEVRAAMSQPGDSNHDGDDQLQSGLPTSLANGEGREGLCQIEGMPLQAELEIHVTHSSMKPQKMRFVVSSLRAFLTFGTDIVFHLWASEAAGGLALFACKEDLSSAAKLPKNASAFTGRAEMTTGEILPVKGRMQLPWEGFSQTMEGVVNAPYMYDVDECGVGVRHLDLFGIDCFSAANMELPTVGKMTTWLPESISTPSEILCQTPFRTVLTAVRGVVLALQSDPSVSETLSPKGMTIFERILENGCQFMDTFSNMAWEQWKEIAVGHVHDDTVASSYQEVYDKVISDPWFDQIAEQCESIKGQDAVAQTRVELDRVVEDCQLRGKQLATAYIRAAEMKPWLDDLCAQAAAATHSKILRAHLKGACGSTRVFEKMALRPEEGSPWDLVRCSLLCTSLERVYATVVVILKSIESAPEARVAGIINRLLKPNVVRGNAVLVYVAWQAPKDSKLQVGEIEIMHHGLRKAQSNSEQNSTCSNRFFAELTRKHRKKATRNAGTLEDEPIEAFSMVDKFFMNGYHSAGLDPLVEQCTMHQLDTRECVQIAFLPAPEVILQIVTPGEPLPLEGVRVEVEREHVVKSDRFGLCKVVLHPGEHVLKFRLGSLTPGWVERKIVIDSMAPRFQIPLPLNFTVWRSPLIVRGELYAWDIWVTCGGAPVGDRGEAREPMCGSLQVRGSGKLDIANGLVSMNAGPVVSLDEEPPAVKAIDVDPLERFSLTPPFARRVGEVRTRELWQPRFLGMRSEGPLVKGAASSKLVVCARTRCCCAGVPGVSVVAGDGRGETSVAGSGTTNSDGIYMLEVAKCSEHQVCVKHLSFEGGAEDYVVCSADEGAEAAPAELPIFFEAAVHLFLIPADTQQSGDLLLQALAGSALDGRIPKEARPFTGQLRGSLDAERWIQRQRAEGSEDGSNCNVRTLRPPVAKLAHNASCPLSTLLEMTPEEPGYLWCPRKTQSAVEERCSLQALLSKNQPTSLGVLRPIVTVMHIDGTVYNMFVKDCPTVGRVASDLALKRGMSSEVLLPLAEAHKADATVMESDTTVHRGQQLRVLGRIDVRITFGKSSLGVAGATVKVNKMQAITAACGECSLFVTPGKHTLFISHPLLGEVQQQQVEVNSLETTLTLATPATLYVFAESGLPERPSSISVWTCAIAHHIPKGAEPLTGTLWAHGLASGSSASPVGFPLKAAKAPLVLQTGIPIDGISLECERGDYVWQPSSPRILDSSEAWATLLQGPIQAGRLLSSIHVQYHNLSCVDSERDITKLPAETPQRTGDVLAALAPRLNMAADRVGAFLGEQLLSQESLISPWALIQLWPLSPLEVHVATQCCQTGIRDVTVRVCEEHSMTGKQWSSTAAQELLQPGSLVMDTLGRLGTIERRAGRDELDVRLELDGAIVRLTQVDVTLHRAHCMKCTDSSGQCSILTNSGEHQVYLSHPLLRGCAGFAHGCLQRDACTDDNRSGQNLKVIAEISFYVYTTPLLPQAETGALRVWMSVHLEDMPEEARPFVGTVLIPTSEGRMRIGLTGGSNAQVKLPNDFGNGHAGIRCALRGLSFEAEPADYLAWCLEEGPPAPAVSARDGPLPESCLHIAMANGPISLGVLKPALVVHCQDGSRLSVPVAESGTVGAVRERVAGHLRSEAAGIYLKSIPNSRAGAAGARILADDEDVRAGMELSAGFLAALVLQVVAPEGEEGIAGLENVIVDVDGTQCGKTDENGQCEVRVPAGSPTVILRHPTFAPAGFRTLTSSIATSFTEGERYELQVVGDVRLHVYATDPEEEPISSEEDEPMIESTVVFVAACSDQIPEDALGVDGNISGIGIDGLEVQKKLDSTKPSEFLLVSGEETGHSRGSTPVKCCSLTSLQIDARRPGFTWRPKEPTPFVERYQEFGGSEYLRLVECPVAVGYLDPTIQVHFAYRPTLEVPVRGPATVRAVTARIREKLGITESDGELRLFHSNGSQLDTDSDSQLAACAKNVAGMQLTAMEMTSITVRAISSCCGEAVNGAQVLLDGVAAGFTDKQGSCTLAAALGPCKLSLRHPAFGQKECSVREVNVLRTECDFLLPIAARMHAYFTNPEEDEGEEALEERVYQPSLVWLAIHMEHIPDDAQAMRACAICACSPARASQTPRIFRARLVPERLKPFVLNFADAEAEEGDLEPSGEKLCPLGSLSLRCTRPGFQWEAKDPSPLAERTQEIGGCEMPRLLECPLAVGFFKPTVTVHCAQGERLTLPLENFGAAQKFRAQVAKELNFVPGGSASGTLTFATVTGAPFEQLLDEYAQGQFLKEVAHVLCARPGELISDAKTAFERYCRLVEKDGHEELYRLPDGVSSVKDIQQEEAV